MYIQKGHSESNPIGNVVSPMVVGGAIIAVKCKEGVIIANDTLLAYGGLLSNTLIKFRIS
jgi:20S proteasome alpha/beta subunit